MSPELSPAERLRRLRTEGGLKFFQSRTRLTFRGADTVRYLNGQISNNVLSASVDRSVEACVLTAKGKLCGVVRVWPAGDEWEMDAEAGEGETLRNRFERYIIADDVVCEERPGGVNLCHVFGPAAEAAIFPCGVRTSRVGTPGIDAFGDASEQRQGVDSLKAAGVLEATDVEWDVLRISACVPAWGLELNEDRLPAEAGLDQTAVDFFKGCYVGQEVVSRIRSVGRVNRELRLLVIEALHPPAPGGELLAGDTVVGLLTSVAVDFDLSRTVALGYVKHPHESGGTRLRVRVDGAEVGEAIVQDVESKI